MLEDYPVIAEFLKEHKRYLEILEEAKEERGLRGVLVAALSIKKHHILCICYLAAS